MLKNPLLLNKTLVIIIILLFTLVSIVPGICGIVVKSNIDFKNSDSSASTSSVFDWWPMYNHDPENSGYTTSIAPNNGTLRWIFNANSQMSSPVVYEALVYVGSGDGLVYCLDMNTGEKIWQYETGGGIDAKVSPAIIDSRVFVGTDDGKVYCLEAETGSLIWKFITGGSIESSPVVVNGKVYIGSYDKKMYCLNAETGLKIWEYETFDWIITSPAVVNDRIYFGSFDKNIYCLNAETGIKIWNFPTDDSIQATSPSVSDGRLYIGSDDDKLYCLDAETGVKIWDFSSGGSIHSSPAVAYGFVYFGSEDTNTYCLDAETGDKIWEYSLGNWIHSSPSVADNKVYIASMGTDGQICCLNAQTGVQIWNYSKAVWSSPAIADGKLFFGCYNFYCFEDGPYQAPYIPEITGPTQGSPKTTYDYTFSSTEPNGDDIYYYVIWGDGTYEDWFGPYSSDEEVTLSHAFPKRNTYKIKAKAKDNFGLESDWGSLEVIIPRGRNICFNPFHNILEKFPFILRILNLLL